MQRISCLLTVLLGAVCWATAPAEAAHGGSIPNAQIVGRVLRCGGGARGPTRCFPANRAAVSAFNFPA